MPKAYDDGGHELRGDPSRDLPPGEPLDEEREESDFFADLDKLGEEGQ